MQGSYQSRPLPNSFTEPQDLSGFEANTIVSVVLLARQTPARGQLEWGPCRCGDTTRQGRCPVSADHETMQVLCDRPQDARTQARCCCAQGPLLLRAGPAVVARRPRCCCAQAPLLLRAGPLATFVGVC